VNIQMQMSYLVFPTLVELSLINTRLVQTPRTV